MKERLLDLTVDHQPVRPDGLYPAPLHPLLLVAEQVLGLHQLGVAEDGLQLRVVIGEEFPHSPRGHDLEGHHGQACLPEGGLPVLQEWLGKSLRVRDLREAI